MRSFPLALAALVLAVQPALAQPRPRVITQPDWLQRPSGDDVADSYPKVANELQVSGRATLSCKVTEVGTLADCAVVEETPKAMGFGEAAMSLTSSFRMRPQTVDGEPVSGGLVRIPIRFTLPEPPSPDLGPPTSPQALALARQFVADARIAESFEQLKLDAAQELSVLSPGDASGALAGEAAQDLRRATDASAPELKAALARLYAAHFAAAELGPVAAFAKTRGAQVILGYDADAQAVSEMGDRETVRRIITEGRRAVCGGSCQAGPEPAQLRQVDFPVPLWVNQPTHEQLVRGFPEAGRTLGLDGLIDLVCTVGADGLLEGCQVERENPKGFGFAAAAQSLIPQYRLVARARGDTSRPTVRVALRFPSPILPEAAEPTPPRSPAAMALAREVVRLAQAAQGQGQLATAFDEILAKMTDPDAAALARAKTAARQAFAAAWAAHLEEKAASLTLLMTDAELQAAVALLKTPGGRKLMGPNEAFQGQMEELWEAYSTAVAMRAGDLFCSRHDCAGPRPAQPSMGVSPAASTRKP